MFGETLFWCNQNRHCCKCRRHRPRAFRIHLYGSCTIHFSRSSARNENGAERQREKKATTAFDTWTLATLPRSRVVICNCIKPTKKTETNGITSDSILFQLQNARHSIHSTACDIVWCWIVKIGWLEFGHSESQPNEKEKKLKKMNKIKVCIQINRLNAKQRLNNGHSKKKQWGKQATGFDFIYEPQSHYTAKRSLKRLFSLVLNIQTVIRALFWWVLWRAPATDVFNCEWFVCDGKNAILSNHFIMTNFFFSCECACAEHTGKRVQSSDTYLCFEMHTKNAIMRNAIRKKNSYFDDRNS